MEEMIALKPCRHCAFTRHHLGTKDEVREALAHLKACGANLACHEYTEPTICANWARKYDIKGKRRPARGDLKRKYAHITRAEKDRGGLGGLKLLLETGDATP